MRRIVEKAIGVYQDQRRTPPKRVVVHKTSRFTTEELDGCEAARQGVDLMDAVQVHELPTFQAYHDKHTFPVLRGTLIADNNEGMLFTSGYVPALGTYPGPAAPSPLHLIGYRLDTSIRTVSMDIMNLTKLDWNSTTFYRKMPVTLGVSKKVGSVMAELSSEDQAPPASYKYYM